MNKKITISTEVALELMNRTGFDANITDAARNTLAQLCNVKRVAGSDLPRALESVKPHLCHHIPWLREAANYLRQKRSGCANCTIDHTDYESMRECPVAHRLIGIVLLFGESCAVPPLPAETHTGDAHRWN